MLQPMHRAQCHRPPLGALLSVVAAMLGACGGGADLSGTDLAPRVTGTSAGDSTTGPAAQAAQALRGTVLYTTQPLPLSRRTIDRSVSVEEAPLVTNRDGAMSADGNAKCDVQVMRLTYGTINPQDAPKSLQATAKASAVLMVPGADCPGPWPMLSQQHGTSIGAGGVGQEGVLSMAAYYGSQGYVVVMPDYHGYAESSVPYHPYLQAEPSAAVVIDAVRAARSWLNAKGYGTQLGPKLFLAGTSQGGYVTMATQRSMERFFPGEFTLTAVAPTSGPYQVQATFDQFMALDDTPEESKTVGATFIIEGFQQRHGDLYANPAEAYRASWVGSMGKLPPLLPSTTTSSDVVLRRNCKLPFNLKDLPGPKTPIYDGCNSEPLLTESFVTAYRDGTGGAARLRLHAADNNLLQNWKPTSRTFVCYGHEDTMATPNAVAAQSYFQQKGAGALLTLEDLETETQPVILHWMITQKPRHPPGAGYHGKVEAPACTSWSRHTVFDPLR